jgi:hypothetical protein
VAEDLIERLTWAISKAGCPETEQVNGIRLIFLSSHRQANSQRCFDATDTEIRIRRRTENPNGRMSSFIRFHHSFDNCEPWIDITAWTWNDLFSTEMLDERLGAYNIGLHFDGSLSACKQTDSYPYNNIQNWGHTRGATIAEESFWVSTRAILS